MPRPDTERLLRSPPKNSHLPQRPHQGRRSLHRSSPHRPARQIRSTHRRQTPRQRPLRLHRRHRQRRLQGRPLTSRNRPRLPSRRRHRSRHHRRQTHRRQRRPLQARRHRRQTPRPLRPQSRLNRTPHRRLARSTQMVVTKKVRHSDDRREEESLRSLDLRLTIKSLGALPHAHAEPSAPALPPLSHQIPTSPTILPTSNPKHHTLPRTKPLLHRQHIPPAQRTRSPLIARHIDPIFKQKLPAPARLLLLRIRHPRIQHHLLIDIHKQRIDIVLRRVSRIQRSPGNLPPPPRTPSPRLAIDIKSSQKSRRLALRAIVISRDQLRSVIVIKLLPVECTSGSTHQAAPQPNHRAMRRHKR